MPCEVLQYLDNVPSPFDYIMNYVVPNKTQIGGESSAWIVLGTEWVSGSWKADPHLIAADTGLPHTAAPRPFMAPRGSGCSGLALIPHSCMGSWWFLGLWWGDLAGCSALLYREADGKQMRYGPDKLLLHFLGFILKQCYQPVGIWAWSIAGSNLISMKSIH